MTALLAFNRGIVSPLALARVDLKRLQLSAEEQTNWMPRAMGPMMLRPGFGHIASTRSDAASKTLEFIYSTSDTALVELTDGILRVLIDDVVVRRPAVTSKWNRWDGAAFVSSSDTASTFVDATEVGYWRDNDEVGGTSAFASGGYLSLAGNGTASAIRDRSIAVVETNVEHCLNIVVSRGTIVLRVGSTEGGEEYLTDRTLRQGQHSISVTPSTSTMFVRLYSARNYASLVDSVTLVQSASDMEIPTPWTSDDLQYVRSAQSGDVMFVACRDVAQKRIERQGADSPRSWSVVDYLADNGPFRELNTGPTRIKGSALTGDITLTAEREFFRSTHVGALFSLPSAGQEVEKNILAEDTWSDPIRVVGVGSSRSFGVSFSGTFTGTTTVTLQRSVAEPGDWSDVRDYTGPVPDNVADGLDNQIIYYRIGVKTGEFTPGDDITATLTFASGSITGIVRVTGYTSGTSVTARVLQALGKADQYTQDWREGDWSPRRGYPSAVAMFGGRLYWAGKGYEWGSVPDSFDSFDDTVEGDSAPIRRTIGEGPIDDVNWLLPTGNLFIGLQGTVAIARSSSLDEPLTQAKFDLKPIGDMGTAALPAIRIDTSGVFVGANGSRVYEIAPEPGSYSYGTPGDLTALAPEIGNSGFVRRAFQRYPDRRLHLVRADGTVAVMVFDKLENVTCWIEVETDGFVEDVVVLPGHPDDPREDRVYYTVRRVINGVTKRFHEKWATEEQGQGAADTRLMDCHVAGTLSGSASIPAAHLEGETVCIWGNGKDLGTAVVTGGVATASEAITGAYCAGLSYRARYKSAKRALSDTGALLLSERKRVRALALILANTHCQGVRYGEDFDNLDDLPLIEEGGAYDTDTVWTAYDHDAFTVNGTWNHDSRLCLEAASPRPCTVMAALLKVET
jgi:hypothetical protein